LYEKRRSQRTDRLEASLLVGGSSNCAQTYKYSLTRRPLWGAVDHQFPPSNPVLRCAEDLFRGFQTRQLLNVFPVLNARTSFFACRALEHTVRRGALCCHQVLSMHDPSTPSVFSWRRLTMESDPPLPTYKWNDLNWIIMKMSNCSILRIDLYFRTF